MTSRLNNMIKGMDSRKVLLGLDIFFTILMLVLCGGLLILLGFQKTAGTITSETFWQVYLSLGIISTMFMGISTLYHVFDRSHDIYAEKLTASALFTSDTTNLRFLSHPILKILIWGSLTIGVAVLVLFSGYIVTPPNPYNAEPLSQALLETQPTYLNAWNIGAYPGLFEEAPIFMLVNLLVLAISWGIAFIAWLITRTKRVWEIAHHPAIFIIAVFISVTIGATVFMEAHNAAYGLDAGAKVSAFVFEWIMQLMNQLTGTFLSWIPHFANNAIAVIFTNTSFAIGGFASAVFVIMPRPILRLYAMAWHDMKTAVVYSFKDLRRVFQ